ncbi:MAG TPA: SRPBCC family protein [Gemmatimonadales bacterium]|jgi:uncharacterized protein YndB with AHSA1/START domain
MTERTTHHLTFVIERTYNASPERVFAAWATLQAKARWFAGGEGWTEKVRELDFRVGGHERLMGVWSGGPASDFNATYQDIVPNQRIVYTYDMHLDQTQISVSLATVEFKPAGAGTRLIFTEQAVFLDGYDKPEGREQGTRGLLNNLEAALRREHAGA